MITDRDISKLKTAFATKEDIGGIETRLEGHIYRLDYRLDTLEGKVDAIDEKLDGYVVSVDGIAGKYDTLVMENHAGGVVLSRHTRQIETLAKKTGTRLPD